ncbi:MAG: hypothetical protein JW932_20510 [Deltaproteobacteria bacterium]|nr:hypothetical protein [Deltaproteobacteria bacterium]
MKHWKWQVLLGISLIGLSTFVYFSHYLIFRDAHHIFLYLIGDVAFVFVEILLVTMIIHRLLEEREKRIRQEKLNMVIGVFFSEVGTKLLKIISAVNSKKDEGDHELSGKKKWASADFTQFTRWLKEYHYEADHEQMDWPELKKFFMERRYFLLRLLENPNLLEHQKFTELLQAVFHLGEELSARDHFDGLPDSDYKHLGVDIKRVYVRLVQQWVIYMSYLKGNYPYLFSLALRMNPFDQDASAIVKE